MRLTMLTMGALAVSLMATMACGDDPAPHEPITVDIEIVPNPATVGSPIEVEVRAMEGTEPVMPSEVHIEFAEVGMTTHTEMNVEAHEDHHKATHTFTTAGTYEIHAEAHIPDGEHEEVIEASAQLVVQ